VIALVAAASAAEPDLDAPEPRPPSFALERIDLVAADPGTWVNYDLPMAGAAPGAAVLRFVEQVQVVLATPVEHVYLGVSIGSQSMVLEYGPDTLMAHPPRALGGVSVYGGIQAVTLLPRGAIFGVALSSESLRVSAGASLLSAATWRRPAYLQWNVLPTIGLGLRLGRRQ
jgi:hypothetical protein